MLAPANRVADLFVRKAWNESWEYPLISTSTQFSIDQEFPVFAPLYFSWEQKFDGIRVAQFSRKNYWLSPLFVTLYLGLVYFGRKWMENRKPFNLKTPLKYWNLFLAVFSFWGAVRIVPHLAYFNLKHGFSNSICTPLVWHCGKGACAFWGMAFVYSKFFELVDTVFIILRKSNLMFLHWYHHLTVLLYAWDCYVEEQPPCLYFCAMNYTVHAVMYLYYFLAASGFKPKWSMCVTTLQIMQMLVGCAVTVSALLHARRFVYFPVTNASNGMNTVAEGGCYVIERNIYGGILMYISYLYLFVSFFIEKYFFQKSKPCERALTAKSSARAPSREMSKRKVH